MQGERDEDEGTIVEEAVGRGRWGKRDAGRGDVWARDERRQGELGRQGRRGRG